MCLRQHLFILQSDNEVSRCRYTPMLLHKKNMKICPTVTNVHITFPHP